MPSLEVTRYVPPTSPNAPTVHLFVLDDPVLPAATSCSKPVSAPNEWCETTFAAGPAPLFRLPPKRTCVGAGVCQPPQRAPRPSVTNAPASNPAINTSSTNAPVERQNFLWPSEPNDR